MWGLGAGCLLVSVFDIGVQDGLTRHGSVVV